MARKSFIAGSIVGAGLTALTIFLFTPQDGNDIIDELDYEIEDIKEKITHREPKEKNPNQKNK